MPNKSNGKVEGEGSYTGTRKYNAHLKQWIEEGKIEESAARARKAVEEQGAELREAEAKARSGPDKTAAARRKSGGTKASTGQKPGSSRKTNTGRR